MRIRPQPGFLLSACLLFLLMTSCASAPPEPVGGGGLQFIPTETSKPNLIALDPTPTATLAPAALSTAEQILSTVQAPVGAFKLCSPLLLHTLEELPQIIGDPYNPPPPGREERHQGIDFAYYHYSDRDSMLGEPVQSVLSGKVASVLNDKFPYGNMVMVETAREDLPEPLLTILEFPEGDSLYLLYAHMNLPPLVKIGERVEACQQLGEVGMSGNTDIPHLHLETRFGPAGTVFESMLFYSTRATQAEMDNYVLWRTSGVFQHFDPMRLLSYRPGD